MRKTGNFITLADIGACYHKMTYHCKAIDLIVRNGKVGEVYNIGGHNERTNIEIVKTILEAFGKPELLIEYVKDRPGHDQRYAMDPTKMETELG